MKLKTFSAQAAAFLVGCGLMGAAITVVLNAHAADTAAAKSKSVNLVVDDRPLSRDVKLGTSFAPIVKKVEPSVVRIDIMVNSKEETVPQGFAFPDDPFFRRFFGGNMPEAQRHVYSPPERGVGSGVIVSKDGYILTNNHVVDSADQVKVTLTDGRTFVAKVVGKDPDSDLAVVKIKADDLPALALADSGKIEVGDVVLAVGNPFGIGQSVTMGIISATDRATMGLGYEDFIQTDAAINPGNSGGALVDAEGRLIGVNTAIYSRTGGNQGVGFAIPTDLAHQVMVSLIDHGKVTRGYLGVMIQDLNPTLAKQFDVKDSHGALVGDVVPNGPADKAGLKNGDVIIGFNDKPVVDSRHLKMDVAATVPGESVPVKILRDGDTKTLTVKVKELPGHDEVAKAGNGGSQEADRLHGVVVQDLDSQGHQQFNIPSQIKGALVTSVDPASASADAGLKTGDVIEEIDRHAVKSAEDAVNLTEHAKEKTTLLRVWSENGSHYLVVDENQAG